MKFDFEYYQENYKDYWLQNPTSKMVFYLGLIKKFVSQHDKLSLLDLGCGLGCFIKILPKEWDIYALDPSQTVINYVKQTIPRANLAVESLPNISFKKSFDVITAFDVLEHVQDLENTFSEIEKKLKLGGLFIFGVPVYDGVTGPIIRFLDKDPTHIHKTSRQFWLKLAKEKFEIMDWLGVYRYYTPISYYIHIPTKTLRNFTPAIIVICRKKNE